MIFWTFLLILLIDLLKPMWSYFLTEYYRLLSSVSSSLCSGLKCLLKVRYIILVELLWIRFLIFKTVFLCRSTTLPYVWKIYHKNEWYLRLVVPIFTKLSQNVYLVNTHIFIFWHARCDRQLWNVSWFYCVF